MGELLLDEFSRDVELEFQDENQTPIYDESAGNYKLIQGSLWCYGDLTLHALPKHTHLRSILNLVVQLQEEFANSLFTGSWENVIATYVARKLKLQDKEHPHSYHPAWLHQNNKFC